MTDLLVAMAATGTSAVTARIAAGLAITRAPSSLIRTNVSGERVPAVLGLGVLAGACVAAVVIAAWIAVTHGDTGCEGPGICMHVLVVAPWELVWVPLVPIIGMFAAGTWDDLRGDERPRGFGGHLAAARGGALTGGVVKLVAGAGVALVTIVALDNQIPPMGDWLLLAAPIALTANLINLFDRAPGRALKIFLVVSVPLLVLVPGFRIVGAGSVGAALALLGPDLKARAMLGDAGANPLGAMMGLGLIVAVASNSDSTAQARWGLATLVAVLLALNMASEKWSFSRIIETTPWLARLDHLGRK